MRDGLHPVLAGPSRLLRLKLNLAENLRYCRPSPRNRWVYSYKVRLNDREQIAYAKKSIPYSIVHARLDEDDCEGAKNGPMFPLQPPPDL